MKKRFGDSRDTGTIYSTMPPRTRPGQTYPGGRKLRRALRRLCERRVDACPKTVRGNPVPAGAYTLPGSMKP